MVPCWAGSGPTSAVVRSSSAAAPLGRFQRLCHAVSRRARSLGRFCSCCIPQIYWGSSKDMTSFLICMPTTHRSAATHLHRMPLLSRLSTSFGVHGTALAWLTSYLTNRFQTVRMGSVSSNPSNCSSGVPQGSVLGPILFSLYISPHRANCFKFSLGSSAVC